MVTIFFLALILTIVNPINVNGHAQNDQVPCDIKLVFGINEKGLAVVTYVLEMQIHNRQRRSVNEISIHWLNTNAKIIGNSSATCGDKHRGIEPAEFGSCKHTVQTINERLLEQLGQDTWTKIINSEMRNFREVRACAIIGYNYGGASVKNY